MMNEGCWIIWNRAQIAFIQTQFTKELLVPFFETIINFINLWQTSSLYFASFFLLRTQILYISEGNPWSSKPTILDHDTISLYFFTFAISVADLIIKIMRALRKDIIIIISNARSHTQFYFYLNFYFLCSSQIKSI